MGYKNLSFYKVYWCLGKFQNVTTLVFTLTTLAWELNYSRSQLFWKSPRNVLFNCAKMSPRRKVEQLFFFGKWLGRFNAKKWRLKVLVKKYGESCFFFRVCNERKKCVDDGYCKISGFFSNGSLEFFSFIRLLFCL